MSEHCGVSQSVTMFGVLPRRPDVISRVIVGVSPSHMESFFSAYCCFDKVTMGDSPHMTCRHKSVEVKSKVINTIWS